jgi:hypothetical protein
MTYVSPSRVDRVGVSFITPLSSADEVRAIDWLLGIGIGCVKRAPNYLNRVYMVSCAVHK